MGYGANKAACLYEIYLSGAQFWVLPEDFLIHQRHPYPENDRRVEVIIEHWTKTMFFHIRNVVGDSNVWFRGNTISACMMLTEKKPVCVTVVWLKESVTLPQLTNASAASISPITTAYKYIVSKRIKFCISLILPFSKFWFWKGRLVHLGISEHSKILILLPFDISTQRLQAPTQNQLTGLWSTLVGGKV